MSGRRYERASLVGRRGFTLVEMLVSLAVLVLALGMVATVFQATTETAAVSKGIADVENSLRNFENELRADLDGINPARSVLVIRGRTQAASLTEDQRRASVYWRELIGDPQWADNSGYDPATSTEPANPATNGYSDPRADLMMFFTERALASNAPATGQLPQAATTQRALQRGARIAPAQIVYGHAAVGRVIPSGGGWDFPTGASLRHISESNAERISDVPLTEWVLARRQALLLPVQTIAGFSPTQGFFPNGNQDFMRRIVRGVSEDDEFAADALPFRFEDFLRMFQPGENPWVPAGFGVEENLARYSPYLFPSQLNGYDPTILGALPGNVANNVDAPDAPMQWLDRTLYANGNETADVHVATALQDPPAELQDNLALQALPGCAWFQVEFLLPEDPRNSREVRLGFQQQDTPRWVSVTPGYTYVFVPDSEENRELVSRQIQALEGGALPQAPAVNSRLATFGQIIPPSAELGVALPDGELNTVENRMVRMWPYAIRVTVRVFDRNGDLDRPITRRIVHWFE